MRPSLGGPGRPEQQPDKTNYFDIHVATLFLLTIVFGNKAVWAKSIALSIRGKGMRSATEIDFQGTALKTEINR